ncbi:MBL fold metallo-hydrolase [Tepidibacillus infernus]|uniref:ComEC/Rec2 family competence protein n=1 Tax=Tepidibacillus TaxID=1494427 RepID=UPI0008532EB5|nr:MBL fold metallo-hydrolase [Tepidibacillus sp. HK-1]GBF11724.1 ComEC family competence protein [Tepidibacillus sp. HK-1]
MQFTIRVFTVILFIFAFIYIRLPDQKTVPSAKFIEIEPNEMLVSFLPLKQGEATLIQLSDREFYLIDTGSPECTEQLLTMLNQHGVGQLKGLILTNPSDDHFGGFNQILNQYSIQSIYIPELISSTFPIPSAYQKKIKKIKAQDEIQINQNIKIVVLSPIEPLSLSPQANSLVFQLIHKDVQILFTSDINQEIEQRLLERYPLKSEILKVSDFGGVAGSDATFLEKVDAQVGIIFSSDRELYALSEDVLERLNESWMDVMILEKEGEVQILSNGTNYSLERVNY